MKNDLRTYFAETILPFHDRMYAAALAITGSPDDASDAVQTAALRIWEAVSRGNKIESPMSYCLSTVRNICINEVRRNKRNILLETDVETFDEVASYEKATELNEVTDALSRLAYNEKRAIEMSAYAGCSAQEIADALDTTAANARQILCRGRKKLRSFFS